HNSSEASRAKNFSGFVTLSFHILRYCSMEEMRAFLANSRAGLKTRFSTRWDSMALLIQVGKMMGCLATQPRGDKCAAWKIQLCSVAGGRGRRGVHFPPDQLL